jgi:hypothetical protein
MLQAPFRGFFDIQPVGLLADAVEHLHRFGPPALGDDRAQVEPTRSHTVRRALCARICAMYCDALFPAAGVRQRHEVQHFGAVRHDLVADRALEAARHLRVDARGKTEQLAARLVDR